MYRVFGTTSEQYGEQECVSPKSYRQPALKALSVFSLSDGLSCR